VSVVYTPIVTQLTPVTRVVTGTRTAGIVEWRLSLGAQTPLAIGPARAWYGGGGVLGFPVGPHKNAPLPPPTPPPRPAPPPPRDPAQPNALAERHADGRPAQPNAPAERHSGPSKLHTPAERHADDGSSKLYAAAERHGDRGSGQSHPYPCRAHGDRHALRPQL